MDQVHKESFQSEKEEYEEVEVPINVVSVLKHLPGALEILEGHHYQQPYVRCLYEVPLSNNPQMVTPKPQKKTNALPNPHRLFQIEDTMFEHAKMKEKIQNLLNKNKRGNQYIGSLWKRYSNLKPCYCRFGLQMKKNNFANVLIPLNGLNIVPKYTKEDTKPLALSSSPDSLRFDSNFESGNLLYAYRMETNQIETYDLIMQNDINTKGHNQWFYFKVFNLKRHHRVRFNIVNFIKGESMFSYGVKPLTFSQKNYSRNKVGWVRAGERISYEQNNIKRQSKDKSYYTLSFEYYFSDVDTIYFAPAFPYTCSQLNQFYAQHCLNAQYHKILSVKPLAETVGKNVVNVITIGTGQQPLSKSKIIWILGRQHPGQTTSSYMIEGIIQYLTSVYKQCDESNRKVDLSDFIFKIVPIVNVDGVIHGNTRGELMGIDPNRMWKKPLKRLCPTINAIKKQILRCKENVSMVLDLHSHSKKPGCFFYGNSYLHDPKISKIYPYLVCKNDKRFSFDNCRYRGGYETTARKVLFEELSIPFVYTVQCSLLGYINPKTNRIVEYQLADYYQMGKNLIQSFFNLQNIKVDEQMNELIQDVEAVDKYEIESARSESSLSNQEYEETRFKVKKVPQSQKKKKSKDQTVVPKIHYQVKRNFRQEKIKSRKELYRTKNYLKEVTLNNVEHKNSKSMIQYEGDQSKTPIKTECQKQLTPYLVNCNPNKTLDSKPNKKSLSKGSRVFPFKKNQQSFRSERKDVEVQVNFQEQMRTSKIKRKNDETLYVIGNSLEDENVVVSKNNVGLQVYEQLLVRKNGEGEKGILKKQSKLKKGIKIGAYFWMNASKENKIGKDKNDTIKKLSENILGIKNG